MFYIWTFGHLAVILSVSIIMPTDTVKSLVFGKPLLDNYTTLFGFYLSLSRSQVSASLIPIEPIPNLNSLVAKTLANIFLTYFSSPLHLRICYA